MKTALALGFSALGALGVLPAVGGVHLPFVSDGYNGNRVAKFDKSGKFLLDWGQKATPPDKRPGYMSNVHGIAVDPVTRRVFVNDRADKRIQVFDENGKYLYEWSPGPDPSDIHLLYIGADRTLWAADRGTSKMLKYDLEGHFLYSWGIWGDFDVDVAVEVG